VHHRRAAIVAQAHPRPFDDAEARRVSPLFWPPPKGRVFDAVVGGNESSEFLRQSKIITDMWRDAGAQTRYEEIAGANHFTVLDPLTEADSAMTKRAVALAKQVAAMPL